MLVPVVLAVVAAAQILPGLFAFLAPGAFYDTVAPFPPENHHVLRDVGTWQIALGLVALLAIRRPAWHVPILGVFALQYGLHAVSHLIDIDAADPDWNGPVTFALLTLAALVLAALAVREARR
jgi:uncharacterized protein YjeT (DUF2065 family)